MDVTLSAADSPAYDVIVIGGGPAGSSAAIYTSRFGLRTLVLDKGVTGSALSFTESIVNYPGVPGPIRGEDLLKRIRDQARSFGAEFVTDKAVNVELKEEIKKVWGGSGLHQGRAVIVATGAMGRKHRLPGEAELLGRGVSYCATCDGAFFQDRQVAVVGNNDEAVEEALVLSRFASLLHFLSPTAELRAQLSLSDELVNKNRVRFYSRTDCLAILGEGKVEGVRVADAAGNERDIPLEGVFLYLQGNLPVTDFLGDQLDTDEHGCLVDEDFQTAIPGVFAVGDVLCRHLKQAVVAASDGVAAAMAVDRYLSGRSKLRADWAH